MAFYKPVPADAPDHWIYETTPKEIVDYVADVFKTRPPFIELDGAIVPYFDENSADVRIDDSLRTLYVYVRNRWQDPFFVQLDFPYPIDFAYINHDGFTIDHSNRTVAIRFFFDLITAVTKPSGMSAADNLREAFDKDALFDLDGRLTSIGSGAIIQGTAIESGEISFDFKLCLRYVAEEEHRELIARLERNERSSDIVAIDGVDGHQFETLCASILRGNGFTNVEVTKGSGDQGIDILATKDYVKYGIQCKCYSSDIGNKAVQEAHAGKTFYGCNVAVVMTNRHFTPSAVELAGQTGVVLWDRDKLLSMAEAADVSVMESDAVDAIGSDLPESVEQVKEIYASALSLLFALNGTGDNGMLFGFDDDKLKKLYMLSILQYMLWVIDAGVGVSDYDTYIVRTISGEDIDARMIEELIQDAFIPDNFACEPPVLMKFMTKVMAETGVGDPSTVAIPLYESIGNTLASTSPLWTEERLERVTAYLSMLKRMILLNS